MNLILKLPEIQTFIVLIREHYAEAFESANDVDQDMNARILSKSQCLSLARLYNKAIQANEKGGDKQGRFIIKMDDFEIISLMSIHLRGMNNDYVVGLINRIRQELFTYYFQLIIPRKL